MLALDVMLRFPKKQQINLLEVTQLEKIRGFGRLAELTYQNLYPDMLEFTFLKFRTATPLQGIKIPKENFNDGAACDQIIDRVNLVAIPFGLWCAHQLPAVVRVDNNNGSCRQFNM